MTRRYLILGGQGQLGQELRSQLDHRQIEGEDLSYAHADYEECDITNEVTVAAYFADREPFDVVLNAAAYTSVDDAEGRPDRAMMINALGAANVAAACRITGARLIHFSTDFVFGDGHEEPIDETAQPAPLSVYGHTKLVSEEMVLQNNPATAVLRTSGLYSRWGTNFVRAIIHHGRNGSPLKVVDDQYITPTPAAPLARVALEVADAPLLPAGIYHATAQGECTWYEFAQKILELLQLDVELEPTTARKWGAPARRPEYSVLENRRLRLRGLDTFEGWEKELVRFLGERKGGKER